jgi:hypothetical protein
MAVLDPLTGMASVSTDPAGDFDPAFTVHESLPPLDGAKGIHRQ